MWWVYLAIIFMVIIFYVDQKRASKRRVQEQERIRAEEERKWMQELQRDHPEFYKKVFGDKEYLH